MELGDASEVGGGSEGAGTGCIEDVLVSDGNLSVSIEGFHVDYRSLLRCDRSHSPSMLVLWLRPALC